MYVSVCMLLCVINVIHFMGYCLLCHQNGRICQQPLAKRTHSSLLKWPNSKCGYANQTSSNQTHVLSTHGSPHHYQAAATLLRSTTLHSPPLPQLTIPLPLDSAQNHWAFIPHEVFNQLSNALQHLTSSMNANNTPAPATDNAESTRTIKDGTPNV